MLASISTSRHPHSDRNSEKQSFCAPLTFSQFSQYNPFKAIQRFPTRNTHNFSHPYMYSLCGFLQCENVCLHPYHLLSTLVVQQRKCRIETFTWISIFTRGRMGLSSEEREKCVLVSINKNGVLQHSYFCCCSLGWLSPDFLFFTSLSISPSCFLSLSFVLDVIMAYLNRDKWLLYIWLCHSARLNVFPLQL